MDYKERVCSSVTDCRTSKAGIKRTGRCSTSDTRLPALSTVRLIPNAAVALRPASYPATHHSPQNCNSKHACADRRCYATATEIEQWRGLQILRKIELWMGFLHINILHSKQHVVLIITKTPTTCTYKARNIHTYILLHVSLIDRHHHGVTTQTYIVGELF